MDIQTTRRLAVPPTYVRATRASPAPYVVTAQVRDDKAMSENNAHIGQRTGSSIPNGSIAP